VSRSVVLVVAFSIVSIDPAGGPVTRTALDGRRVGDAALEGCLVQIVSGLSFSPSPTGSLGIVSWPFHSPELPRFVE
jgi:hypothetical protein